MYSYIWTLLSFVVAIWFITRLLAWMIQWLLHRYAGVLVHIGSIGLFSCRKVILDVKKGLKIEIDKAWLSSCFVNQEVKKPVVVCISDIRIQANAHQDNNRPNQPSERRTTEENLTLPKFAILAKYIGLKINNLTVMLLNTMIPDCLVHLDGQSINLDIAIVEGCYSVILDVVGVNCKALRSVTTDQLSQPCLAEMSWSTFIHLQARQDNIKHLKSLRLLIDKPHANMTEGFLSSLQLVNKNKLSESLGDKDVPKQNTAKSFNWKLIPQEIGIDVTELDVKIVRETKQRTLSVGLKTFHTEYHQDSACQDEEKSFCGLLLEDFHTESPQVKFAELLKLSLKVLISDTALEANSNVHGGFFNYHHEEVQYWSSVITKLSAPENKSSLEPENIEQSKHISPMVVQFLKTREITAEIDFVEVSAAISSVSCSGLLMGLQTTRFFTSLKPTDTDVGIPYLAHNISCDLEVQTVWCHHYNSHVSPDELKGSKHFWNHVLYLELFRGKLNQQDKILSLDVMTTYIHIEWSTNTINTLLHFFGAITRIRRMSEKQQSIKTTHRPSILQKFNIDIKLDVSYVNVFIGNNNNVALMLRVDSVMLDHRKPKSYFVVEGTKVIYIQQKNKMMKLVKSVNLKDPIIHIQEVKCVYKHQEKNMTIHVLKQVSCDWSTSHHMCIIQAIDDFTELTSRINLKPKRSNTEPKRMEVTYSVIVTADVMLTLRLSKQRWVSLTKENKVVMTLSAEEILLQMDKLIIKCEGHDIITIEGLLYGTSGECTLQQEREDAGCLELPTNRLWNFSFDSFMILFPYGYDFALCFEEFVNLFKWWKLVHNYKRKDFTLESKLPPDLQIKAKLFMVQLGDDPFEVKLGDNFELLKDECQENIIRKNVMDQKIKTLRKQHGYIPSDTIEELYASLTKKSSDIYVKRSRLLYANTPMRTKLFTWTMKDLEIIAMADLSYHGKENAVKHMREIDSDSPYPEEGLEFLTLWCRYVTVNINHWTVMLRDYPQPMFDVKNLYLWGRLVGAEQDGTKRAKRSCTVEVATPWTNMEVERNLPALKFYHDFSCDVVSWTQAYGANWEPCVAQYNVCFDNVNKPSVDPSIPMPVWDKIRLLLHGRLTISIQEMTWLYHASFDPYNTTEFMDWTWTNLLMEWTNANFLLKGDFDISVNTASKYDDCKLLHLPNLRLNIHLDWISRGDPNDHHAVMPCAPDKVPEYSLEDHDSFRAFRSQNLSVTMSLDTKPKHDNTLNVPKCIFYASTLRFLDKIKLCLAGVTRPTRRGALFDSNKSRKPQLTRHYKSIKMAVNLHRFNICYWMSFSKQHGSELLAESFVLSVCNDLSLVPIEDGLFHRPAANWSVRYLSCELLGAKTWLCSAHKESEDEQLNHSLRFPVDKSFFISVSRVTYLRGEVVESDSSDEEEDVKNGAKPTHCVHVYDMKGAWNKSNNIVLIGLYDSYQKAQSLRRNLSSDALKVVKVDEGRNAIKNRTSSFQDRASSPTAEKSDPFAKSQRGKAYSMLMKLVAESDSKSIVFTEEPSSVNMDQLQGVAACQTDDVTQKNWLIELHNSQVIVKGCETPGHVIVSAAHAQVLSCNHVPVWKDNQLRSKTTWVCSVECMQYYATVDSGPECDDDKMAWLSPENVEDRSEPDLSGLTEMVSSGHSVGGVVYSYFPHSKQKSKMKDCIQLQRIISRCKCQIFYASYGECDLSLLPEVPPPPSDDSDMMSREQGADSFTLLHHDLNICTNSSQYLMILDIVNNLLLHTEQSKKETTEKLQSMRFQLQLSPMEDQKTPIQLLQERVREEVQKQRRLEKDIYLIHKILNDEDIEPDPDEEESLTNNADHLEKLLYECKEQINTLNEELSIRISCFQESQLIKIKAQMKMAKEKQAQVEKVNEVCFKFAHWRLTEKDGQLGIADLVLRNFVYSKVNRDNETWTHQLELGWVKVTNLQPNTMYKDVLVPRDPLGKESDRQMALRILCSERSPVGGIAVKEHFEVVVIPLQIQITYQFYKILLAFFFPGETDEDDDVENKKKDKKEKDKKKKEAKKSKSSFYIDVDSEDIDKMKERAANNNTFVYVKIPEVSMRVSYKGEKEKNIEDIHDFSIILPTFEYHNRIWTWFDILMALKNDSKRLILSQAIKQKLHMRSRVGDETPLTDVQQEEDKMKMLLGAKLLAGQDKPRKKSLFGKSQEK
ncbi:protein KIAA0100-like isoform X2 [Mytilus californianus]|uniref:protein KIAA0100-like isoform X2 n=1 Tax=Mytilus californianus TaxID=6549 RepID=UPI002247A149|nr:protein KIAA0100-like isoform X2 [Mytilus californianus]